MPGQLAVYPHGNHLAAVNYTAAVKGRCPSTKHLLVQLLPRTRAGYACTSRARLSIRQAVKACLRVGRDGWPHVIFSSLP